MDIKVLLGKRVREYRQKYGMTQFELAEKWGIDDKHLSRIELGKTCLKLLLLRNYQKSLMLNQRYCLSFITLLLLMK